MQCMKKSVILFLLFFSLVDILAQQNAALVKSDSLFAAGVALYQRGEYNDAIPLFAESDGIDKAELDTVSNRRDYSAWWLASCLYKLGDSSTAAEYYSDYMITPIDRRLTVESDSLSASGLLLIKDEKYDKALTCLKKSAEIERQVSGATHVRYAIALNYLGLCYINLNDTLNAITALRQYVDIAGKNYGTDSSVYYDCMRVLGMVYVGFSKTEEALSALLIAYRGADQTSKPKEWYAHLIAFEYYSLGSEKSGQECIDCYDKALSYLEEAEQTDERVLELRNTIAYKIAEEYCNLDTDNSIQESREQLKKALSYLDKANQTDDDVIGLQNAVKEAIVAYLSIDVVDGIAKGKFSEALALGTEALEICTSMTEKNDSIYAQVLDNLANCHNSLGNYAEAIRLCKEATDLRANSLGTEHIDYALSLSNMATHISSIGNYVEALQLNTEALSIIERIQGKECAMYADVLGNMADYHASLGHYVDAIELAKETLHLREKLIGKKCIDYTISLGCLAVYNSYIGNYDEAIQYETEALDIRKNLLGENNVYCGFSLNNLAGYKFYNKDYNGALEMSKKALAIMANEMGTENVYYANLLTIFSGLCFMTDNVSLALQLEKHVLEIRNKVLGPNNNYSAMSLNNIAYYSFCSGNYAKAVNYGKKAIEIFKNTVGTKHSDCILPLENQCLYCGKMNDWPGMRKYASETSNLLYSLIKRNFRDMTLSERSNFWKKYKFWCETQIHELAYNYPDANLWGNAYDGVLMSKGLLLNSDVEFRTLIFENGDKQSIAQYDNLRMMYAQIAKLRELPVEERTVNVDSLETLANDLERNLLQHSKIFSDFTHNLIVKWQEVQERLHPKEAAVEFVSFPFTTKTDSLMYVAYVLRKDRDAPEFIPLFEEKQLKDISPNEYYTSDRIGHLVWQPLQACLNDIDNIYFSPSGELYNISIENVPCSYLSGKKLSRLSSTRELALIKDKHKYKKAVVYGGLQYDMDESDIIKDSKSYRSASAPYNYTLSSYDAIRGAMQISYLPATKEEAIDVEKSLTHANVKTSLYMDKQGTEASFKALSGMKNNIIHIATHGFYWLERDVVKADEYWGVMQTDMLKGNVEDMAMAHSGLLLAGAEKAMSGVKFSEGVNDGILTAKEIATLNLSGLNLIVMSACQTGLGEVTGDGVCGLQRGFKKAGANSLMMSLWDVDDNATRVLMAQFYNNLTSGMTKYDSLENAKQYLKTHGYNRPEYWAAFILLDAID